MKPSSARVLILLRRAGARGVTQQDAIADAGCYRLAARISDLRADGFDIRAALVTDDHGHRFSRYYLVERPVQLAVGW